MITTYASNTILKQISGLTSNGVFGSSIYLGLCSNPPAVDGTVTGEPEFNGTNGYARFKLGYDNVPTDLRWMADPTNGAMHNKREIHFNIALESWGNLGYVCIFDKATNASDCHLLAWGQLGTMSGGTWTPQTINAVADTVVVIPVNGLEIKVE